MARLLDSNLKVSEFEFQFTFIFRANTLEKGIEHPNSYGLYSITSLRKALTSNNIKQRIRIQRIFQ